LNKHNQIAAWAV